jgi:ubiquinone/menaquinone biosynthesis C-methylase UbiE
LKNVEGIMVYHKLDWTNVDNSENSKQFIDYLDAVTAQTEMKRYKTKSYRLLNIGKGSSVLDTGCGTGDDVLALAEFVGPNGKIVGIDNSKSLIEEANQRSIEKQFPVQFRVGDVHELDFEDNAFDSCRADRVFMHLHDRQQALSEMIRVTRPGGRIVVSDPDWDTMIVEAPDRNLTRKIIDYYVEQLVLNPWSGRELYKLFQQNGLENTVIADTVTLVLTDFSTANQIWGFDKAADLMRKEKPSFADKVESWLSYLKQADDEGFFFSAATGFTVAGEKSSS